MNDGEFIGRVNVLVAQQIKENCKGKKKLTPKDVQISQAAMTTIGMALKQIALELGVDEKDVKKSVRTEVYELKGDLVFILDVPALDADCVISIPFGYWHYNEEMDNGVLQ